MNSFENPQFAAAAASEEQTRAIVPFIFAANPYVIVLFDDKFRIVDGNPEAIGFFGCKTKDEFIKDGVTIILRGVPDVQPNGKPSVPLADRLRAAAEEGSVTFETYISIRYTLRTLKVTMKRIIYKDSFAIVAYVADISEEKKKENELIEQDNLLQLVNHVSIKLIASDRMGFDQNVTEALDVIGNIVNVSRVSIWKNEERDGKTIARRAYLWLEPGLETPPLPLVIDYDDLPELHDIVRKGEVFESDKPIIVAPGDGNGGGPKSQMIVPVTNEDITLGFTVFGDFKKYRKFTAAQAQAMQSLSVILMSASLRQDITQSLVAAHEDALASARSKSEFLSRMSHEIRTPMNAIIGMTMLAKKSTSLDTVRNYLAKVDSSSRQLLGIINDVLDMSKIDANKMEILCGEFDFEKMMQNVFNVIESRVEEKKQNFQYDMPHMYTRYMISDELRLTQVLTNLLSNAVKFTHEEGIITLKVRETSLDDENSLLHIEVIDNGIGVPHDKMESLFDSFEQLDGGITRKYGGTGLGLTICKKIMGLMGGKIWAESEYGVGSKFSIEVKVGWGRTITSEQVKASLRENLRLLVVDDTDDVLEYFQNILGSFSLNCDVASDGYEAVSMVKKQLDAGMPYDVIFLDWNMPGLNGGQTARIINEMTNRKTIVVLISVSDWSEIEAEAKPIGVEHFLLKPVLPSVLYNTLVELTEKEHVHFESVQINTSYKWADKTILLVEDIDINREVAMGILEDTEVKIDVAEDGLQALNMYTVDPEKYALILMDVQMPVMDGFAATREIRASGLPNAQTIPILAMTANAFKEDAEACINSGMNGHIAKPIEVNMFLAELSKYLDYSARE